MGSRSKTNHSAENLLLHHLESGYCLPPLSPVAAKLIDLASEDTCSVRKLAQLIEQDPSLAVSLLKLANSAFFSALHPVSTLRQAILRIGFHQLRVMALSLSLREAFPMEKRGSFDYEGFWRISLYRALLARALSQHVKTCNPVAHEIRNPLVAVTGFARRLSRLVDPSSDGGKYVGVILQESKRLEEALLWPCSTKALTLYSNSTRMVFPPLRALPSRNLP